MLNDLGYSLQAPRKRYEGTSHPDRNDQFEYTGRELQERGREWQPKGSPAGVRVHDFPADSCGKAIPYGVYDMARNEAWVLIGVEY